MNRRTFLATAGIMPAAVRALRAQSIGIEPGFVSLFDGQTLAGWSVQEGPPSAFRVADGAIVVDEGSNFPTWLRSDRQYENFDFRCEFFLKGWMNSGILATRETYRDFVLHLYIRGVRYHNGGVMFRSIPGSQGGRRESYEIQLHDVEGAHYATGSLYSIRRAIYPRIEPEKWFLFQLIVQGSRCLVRINGETVLEYDGLQNVEAGRIELQAHDPGRWIEYKQIKIRRL
jgi:3-keto-disaccharide hydrolase